MFAGEKFLKEYIHLYLEAVLPKLPVEGVASIQQHLTSEAVLSHVSLHLGTKDIILAAVRFPEYKFLAWFRSFRSPRNALVKSGYS